MSITQETLQQHLKDPAIFCCRREKGTVISAADLEDPGLFEDMQEAGLLTLSPDGLRIEQVLGRTLLEDTEALTPITANVLDSVNQVGEEKAPGNSSADVSASEATIIPQSTVRTGGDGMIHIEIGKAEKFEGLKLDVPVFSGAAAPAALAAPAADEKHGEKKVIRQLIKKHIKIKDVKLGNETSIKDGVITIDKHIVKKAVK